MKKIPKHLKNKHHRKIIRSRTLVICHGLTEYYLARYLKSSLRIPLDIKRRTDSSIQITALQQVMSGQEFKNERSLLKRYKHLDTDESSNLNQIKIFPIMDTDDANNDEISQYKRASLFGNKWFLKYFYPIYNERNIEDVLKKIGWNFTRKQNEKGSLYFDLFPVNHKNTLEIDRIQELAALLAACPETNLDELLFHCLREVERLRE
ncbi:hypothetical protein [Levilactobacillus humaensis]|uniref:hypothetical protein n=1 Tax=Levilactobacillus humaensis TaxID=2950375 RepID=UPI0021C2F153|nr:hypothetical protein [Levilactobacillus humaensis]